MKFGDILFNEWAGDSNPGKRTVFLRRSGRYVKTIYFDGSHGGKYDGQNCDFYAKDVGADKEIHPTGENIFTEITSLRSQLAAAEGLLDEIWFVNDGAGENEDQPAVKLINIISAILAKREAK